MGAGSENVISVERKEEEENSEGLLKRLNNLKFTF